MIDVSNDELYFLEKSLQQWEEITRLTKHMEIKSHSYFYSGQENLHEKNKNRNWTGTFFSILMQDVFKMIGQ